MKGFMKLSTDTGLPSSTLRLTTNGRLSLELMTRHKIGQISYLIDLKADDTPSTPILMRISSPSIPLFNFRLRPSIREK